MNYQEIESKIKISTSLSAKSIGLLRKELENLRLPKSSTLIVVFLKTDIDETCKCRLCIENPNEFHMYIDVKIKNYIPFGSRENAMEYIEEIKSDSDIYTILNVVNGRVVLYDDKGNQYLFCN